jgi:hypothetical protein
VHPTAGIAVVDHRITDHYALAIYGTIGGLAGHFRFSVTVQVVHHELGEVWAGIDVFAQVDAPQAGAIQFITINDLVAGITS